MGGGGYFWWVVAYMLKNTFRIFKVRINRFPVFCIPNKMYIFIPSQIEKFASIRFWTFFLKQ